MLQAYPPLERDVRSDAVVIGGGITGALLSDALVRAGSTCTIIDGRDIGQGSTSASTALLQYEIDTPLHQLAARIGRRPAERAYRLGVRAIGQIVQWRVDLVLQQRRAGAGAALSNVPTVDDRACRSRPHQGVR